MAENDSLSNFDFNKVTKGGLFLKFEAGKPVTLRVLTVDPVISTQEFEGADGEITLSTKFAFIVYNFTEEKAQILQATPNMAKKIADLHNDEDFGANIRKIDIKITPTGEKLLRRYEIQVLPKTNDLTNEQIKECQAIDLDEKIENGQRATYYEPPAKDETPGYDAAKAKAAELKGDDGVEGEPINLDDIPF